MGLSVAKVGLGGQRYYLDAVSTGREDNRRTGSEPEGIWLGGGAQSLGLAGNVGPDELRAVFAGGDPGSGERLLPPQSQVHIAAYDLTFAAPKSVSIIFALGASSVYTDVLASHGKAVEASLAYLEREAVRARRSQDGDRVQVATTGAVGAGFVHRSSRATDPHLHTHLVVANLVKGLEGRWSALDARGIYMLARTAGFLYEAHLRFELSTRLGVEWKDVRNGRADLEGIDQSVLRAFSVRRQQVEAHLATTGYGSPRAAEIAALVTRPKRSLEVDFGELRQSWSRRARVLGLGPDEVAATLGRTRGHAYDPLPTGSERLASRVLARLDAVPGAFSGGIGRPQAHNSAGSSFSRADLLRGLCESLPAGCELTAVEQLAEDILRSDRVVERNRSRVHRLQQRQRDTPGLVAVGSKNSDPQAPVERRLWTTPGIVAAERWVLRSMQRQSDAGIAVVPQDGVDKALLRLPQLDETAAQALRQVLTSGFGVEVAPIGGHRATFDVLDTARRAWSEQGVKTFVTAANGFGVARAEVLTGIEGVTLASIVGNGPGQAGSALAELGPGGVLVVNDANRIHSRLLADLVSRTEELGAKALLVGSPRPTRGRRAGFSRTGTFPLLLDELDRNGREPLTLGFDTKDSEYGLPLQVELSRRWPELGRNQPGTTGHGNGVTIAASAASARAALVRDWWEARAAGEEIIMVAAGRSEKETLERHARALMAADRQGIDRREGDRRGAELPVPAMTAWEARCAERPVALVLGDATVLELSGWKDPGSRRLGYYVVGDGYGVDGAQGEVARLGRISEISAPRHVVAEIGPRRWDPRERAIWREAAGRIDSFRLRWGIDDPGVALGPRDVAREVTQASRDGSIVCSSSGSSGVLRRAEKRDVERAIALARRRLGYDLGHDLETARGLTLQRRPTGRPRDRVPGRELSFQR